MGFPDCAFQTGTVRVSVPGWAFQSWGLVEEHQGRCRPWQLGQCRQAPVCFHSPISSISKHTSEIFIPLWSISVAVSIHFCLPLIPISHRHARLFPPLVEANSVLTDQCRYKVPIGSFVQLHFTSPGRTLPCGLHSPCSDPVALSLGMSSALIISPCARPNQNLRLGGKASKQQFCSIRQAKWGKILCNATCRKDQNVKACRQNQKMTARCLLLTCARKVGLLESARTDTLESCGQ